MNHKISLEVAVPSQSLLGEGSIWDIKSQILYWVDILKPALHLFNPKTNVNKTIHLPQYVGAVVPKQSGGLVLALKEGFASINLETEEIKFLSKPDDHPEGNRFNDGKCDPAGRFWAGTISLKEEKNVASLYCLDTNYSLSTKIKGVTISNGIVWSLDEKTMYYIDTPTLSVVAFDYDKSTGNIGNKRTVVSVGESIGWPDGMSIDEEGFLWIAHWGGGQVCRWDPFTGKLLQSIKVPVSQPSSCAFGGENLDELFITSARVGLSEEQLKKEPYAGNLFHVKNIGVKGVPVYSYKG